jgi:hypothetical protein
MFCSSAALQQLPLLAALNFRLSGLLLGVLVSVTTFVLGVLGIWVAISPPPPNSRGKKWAYMSLFVFFALVGIVSDQMQKGLEAERAEKNHTDQIEAEKRFSADLLDIKSRADGIVKAVGEITSNPPKGMSQKQIASLVAGLVATGSKGSEVPKDICEYSNDGLKRLGNVIVPALNRVGDSLYNAEQDAETRLHRGDPAGQQAAQQAGQKRLDDLIRSLETEPSNVNLFLEANHLYECVSTRLNIPLPGTSVFGPRFGNGSSRSIHNEAGALQEMLRKLPNQ